MNTLLFLVCMAALSQLGPCMTMKDKTVDIDYGWSKTLHSLDISESDRRIINGNITTYGEHPYICSLQENSGGRWFFICGSVVYNENTILTAAHCVENTPPSSLRVVCGDYRLNAVDEFQVTTTIAEVRVHPDWVNSGRQGFPNDIATMRPETPLVFNDYISALPIPPRRTKLEKNCVLVGWGVTESGSISSVLRDVTIRRRSNGNCERTWTGLINKGHICFQDRNQPDSSCNGDSGGPAVCGEYLVGVTSWGVRDCVEGFPSVYTRLTSFRRWLRRNSF